jgi:hypothetical protein
MCNGHKNIWEEMTTSVRVANQRDKMIQMQLARLEKKLFTKQENMDFLLGLVKDMVKEKE